MRNMFDLHACVGPYTMFSISTAEEEEEEIFSVSKCVCVYPIVITLFFFSSSYYCYYYYYTTQIVMNNRLRAEWYIRTKWLVLMDNGWIALWCGVMKMLIESFFFSFGYLSVKSVLFTLLFRRPCIFGCLLGMS